MTQIGRFDYESYQDLKTIQKFLASLVDGLKTGKILLSSGNDEMVLEPKDLLRFRVKAKKKETYTKLDIKLSWKEGSFESARDQLSIGSTTNDQV